MSGPLLPSSCHPSVLHANWQRTLKSMSMSQRADPTYCCNAFSNTVLDMWPAFSIYAGEWVD